MTRESAMVPAPGRELFFFFS